MIGVQFSGGKKLSEIGDQFSAKEGYNRAPNVKDRMNLIRLTRKDWQLESGNSFVVPEEFCKPLWLKRGIGFQVWYTLQGNHG